jgi:serine/threonine protein kinase/tetratricopeptide (TPR) repeat protein
VNAATQIRQIGPYILDSLIGAGGMGVVYRGVHESTGARVAVKTVSEYDAPRLSQIRREVQALALLRHPGVVRVIAHGVDAGKPWYAMELLEGSPLAEIARLQDCDDVDDSGEPRVAPTHSKTQLAQRIIDAQLRPASADSAGPSPDTAFEPGSGTAWSLLRLIHNLCETLAYVHGEGVIHRDLKPSNIFVVPSGKPVLVDFGLAANIGDSGGREVLDADTQAAGSINYMAPEQIISEPLDPRCDLYALGCVLFALIAGRPPFVGALNAVIDSHLRITAPRLSDIVSGVPAKLDQLVCRLLKKDRRERIGHARDVAKVLTACGIEPVPWDESLPRARTYLYRPPLVGRSEVLTELEALQRALIAGKSSVVFIEGESGVGKTRLAVEVGQRTAYQGACVIASGCIELSPENGRLDVGSHSSPLEPLRPFLRHLADLCVERGNSVAVEVLGSAGAQLAVFEPALSPFVSRSSSDSLPAQAALTRLYRALHDAVVEVARAAPLLLIIDDLQWADELTLGLLSFLGHSLKADVPVMLLGLLRSEERSAEIEQLTRAEWARRFALPRLDRVALDHMVGGMLSIRHPPVAFIDYLSRQSEGNPFFVAEYLRAAVEEELLVRDMNGRWQLAESAEPTEVVCESLPLPRSLSELVERRMSGLNPRTRRTMLLAGTIGREFDLSTLAAVAALTDDEAIEAIADLVKRQVVEPVPVGSGFRFAHDKLRQIPLSELQVEKRRELHQRVAEILEERKATASEAELAMLGHHWLEGGMPEHAVTPLHRAGDLAAEVHALDRAISHYRKAIEGLPVSPGAPAAALHGRAVGSQIAEKLGDALALRGQFEDARVMFDRASSLTAHSDVLTRARLHARIGKTWEISHAHPKALAEYDTAERALRSAPMQTDEWRRQWIEIQLNRVWVYYWGARIDEMNGVVDDIAAEVTAHGTAVERAKYYAALVQRDLRMSRYAVDEQILANARRSLAASREARAPVDAAFASFVLGFSLVFSDNLDAAETELRSALQAARKLGDLTSETRCIAYLALTNRRANRVREGDELARETQNCATRARMGEYVGLAKACLGWVAWKNGDLKDAERHCREAMQTWESLTFTFPFQWTAGLVLLALGLGGPSDIEAGTLAFKLMAADQARLPGTIQSALEDLVSSLKVGDSALVTNAKTRAVEASISVGYL